MLKRFAAAVILLALVFLPIDQAAADDDCSSNTAVSKLGASIAVQCVTVTTTGAVADATRKTQNDRGVSTNNIPKPKVPISIPAENQRTCDDLIVNCPTIPEPAAPATPAAPAPGAPPAVTTAVLREAAAKITLPAVQPQIGPDPSVNKWGIVAVGYPIWLWTPGTDRVASTVTAQGITVSIDARRTATTFAMGDGTTVRCTTMTPYPGPSNPPVESPTCGYRYPKLPATPGAGYDIRATTAWTVTWSALGQTGTFTMTRAATRHIDVAEIQSVITAR